MAIAPEFSDGSMPAVRANQGSMETKVRSITLLTVLLVLQLFPSAVFAEAAKSDALEYEFCGYESGLDTPEFVAEFNRVEKQRISLGYTRVCDRVFRNYDLEKAIKPWAEILPLLGFIPVKLEATPFAQFELIGGVLNAKIPAFAFLPRTDHVTRVFRRKDGLIISLEEWDLTIIGGGTSEVFRGPDVLVKGWPGYWDISQAKSGKGYSSLWWQGETRKFDLTVNTNLKLSGGQVEMLQLAESVPPGVPSGKEKPVTATIGKPGVLSKRPFPTLPPELIK